MNLSRIIAILVWTLTLATVALPPIQHHPLPPLPKVILLFPVIFFPAAALLIGGYPFQAPRLRMWADRRWGDGAYVRFIQDLKPMLLWGVWVLAGAIACALQTYRSNAPIDAFWLCGFSLSCGIGLLLARAVLAWRGQLMESRSPSAWDERPGPRPTLLPAAIRRLRATNTTAFFAGVGMVAGMNVIAAIGLHFVPNYWTDPTLGLVVQGTLLFALVPLFVFGIQHSDRHSLKEWVGALLRGLCFMLGVIAFSVSYQLIREHLFRSS
jgi:hypothetical protein